MKKFLVLLLALALLFSLAACNGDQEEEDKYALPDPIVTPTDIDEDYVPDPANTAENETYVTDYAEAAARLGLSALNYPEEMQIYRVLLVDEDKV